MSPQGRPRHEGIEHADGSSGKGSDGNHGAADLVLVDGVHLEAGRAEVGREARDELHLRLVRRDDADVRRGHAARLQRTHHLPPNNDRAIKF